MSKEFKWERLIKFIIIGGISFLIDFGIYALLTRVGDVPYIASRVISISLALTWNFSLNRIWTFQARSGKASRQLTRFTTVMLTTSLLNLLLMRIGVTYLKFNDLLVLVTVSALITGINFLSHQHWSYSNS